MLIFTELLNHSELINTTKGMTPIVKKMELVDSNLWQKMMPVREEKSFFYINCFSYYDRKWKSNTCLI